MSDERPIIPREGDLTENQLAFLMAFMRTGEVVASARAVGLSHWSHYWWVSPKNTNPENQKAYAEAWEFCRKVGHALLAAEAHRRAVVGLERFKFTAQGEPVMWKNPETGETEQYREREYSDHMLMKLLEAHSPEEFGPKHKHEHSGELHMVRVKLDRGEKPTT